MASRRVREQLGLEPAERRVLSSSMWPVIRAGDRIRFKRSRRLPRLGEVWVVERGDIHVVHRVLWPGTQSSLFKGDALAALDGWVPHDQLFGPVEAVERGGQWAEMNGLGDRLLGLGSSICQWPYRWLRSRVGFHLRAVPATTP